MNALADYAKPISSGLVLFDWALIRQINVLLDIIFLFYSFLFVFLFVFFLFYFVVVAVFAYLFIVVFSSFQLV